MAETPPFAHIAIIGLGLIGSSIARAVRGARLGDVRRLTLPAGAIDYEVLAISYPAS